MCNSRVNLRIISRIILAVCNTDWQLHNFWYHSEGNVSWLTTSDFALRLRFTSINAHPVICSLIWFTICVELIANPWDHLVRDVECSRVRMVFNWRLKLRICVYLKTYLLNPKLQLFTIGFTWRAFIKFFWWDGHWNGIIKWTDFKWKARIHILYNRWKLWICRQKEEKETFPVKFLETVCGILKLRNLWPNKERRNCWIVFVVRLNYLIIKKKHNSTCYDHCSSRLWESKAVCRTASVFSSTFFLHTADGQASMLLKSRQQIQGSFCTCPWYWTFSLTTERQSGSQIRENLWRRFLCKYRRLYKNENTINVSFYHVSIISTLSIATRTHQLRCKLNVLP